MKWNPEPGDRPGREGSRGALAIRSGPVSLTGAETDGGGRERECPAGTEEVGTRGTGHPPRHTAGDLRWNLRPSVFPWKGHMASKQVGESGSQTTWLLGFALT